MAVPLREARELFERQYLDAQVTRFDGNVAKTAAFIGMERSALYRKLRSLGSDAQRSLGGDRRIAAIPCRACDENSAPVGRQGVVPMPRYAYVNGRYVAHRDACVHIEDRGYQFADGVYEVVPVIDGRLVDEEPHLDRLEYSLRRASDRVALFARSPPVRLRELRAAQRRERRHHLHAGHPRCCTARPQISGSGEIRLRRHDQAFSRAVRAAPGAGGSVITIPDIRWERCDIKSIALLPNVLGKQQAHEKGAFEAWMVDQDGMVTEGTSTNSWIVTADRRVVTRQLGSAILAGITRASLLERIAADGYVFEQRPFSVTEAKGAAEAFLTSSTSLVLPVTQIDDSRIGDGKPGPLTRRLRELFLAYVAR